MSTIKCPRCGSKNIESERRINGNRTCIDCGYVWKMGSEEDTHDKVIYNPELEALKFMYTTSRHLIPIAKGDEFDAAFKLLTRYLITAHFKGVGKGGTN